jgi:hypothetical protein
MRSLKDTQKEFMELLVNSKMGALPYIKEQGSISSLERFHVHRQTVFQNLVNSLRITFPGVWKLIGGECAEGVALAYSHEMSNLPVMSTLEGFGHNFPEFLAKFESTRSLEYLPDFAKLEWLRSLSYNAASSEEVDPDCLMEISQEVIETTHFKFNPSVFFIKSVFPLEKIQELLDNPKSKGLNLKEVDSSYMVICRIKGEVITLWLSKQVWLFLSSVNNGQNLGQAIENFMEYGKEEEVPSLFQLIMRYKLLSYIR